MTTTATTSSSLDCAEFSNITFKLLKDNVDVEKTSSGLIPKKIWKPYRAMLKNIGGFCVLELITREPNAKSKEVEIFHISSPKGACKVELKTGFILCISGLPKNKTLSLRCCGNSEYVQWHRVLRSMRIKLTSVSSGSSSGSGSRAKQPSSFTIDSSGSANREKIAELINSRLEVNKVEEWTVSDVQDWLSYTYIDYFVNLTSMGVGYLFLKQSINGYALIHLDKLQLGNLGVTDTRLLDCVLEEIEELKTKGSFSLNKVKFIRKQRENDHFVNTQTFEQLKAIKAFELVDPVRIKNRFLRINTEELPKFDPKIHDPATSNEFLIKKVFVSSPNSQPQYVLKVKLVLTDMGLMKPEMVMLFAPGVSLLPASNVGSYWGLYHSAIIIGNFYLEWVNDQWCIPKGTLLNMSSGSSRFVASIAELYVDEDFLKVFQDKISQEIAFWNTNMRYRGASLAQKEDYGNCQDFVMRLFTLVGVDPEVKNPLVHSFLENMRRFGSSDPTFAPSTNFLSTFSKTFVKYSPNSKKLTFKSHRELDQFVKTIEEECTTTHNQSLKEMFPPEYFLLKSFDRSMWLRHLRSEHDVAWKPLSSGLEELCPFGNPVSTLSLYAPKKSKQSLQQQYSSQSSTIVLPASHFRSENPTVASTSTTTFLANVNHNHDNHENEESSSDATEISSTTTTTSSQKQASGEEQQQ